MPIEIRPVLNRKDLKTFIYLPADIHSGHVNWVPPIYTDEWGFYNPDKNMSFRHCMNIMFLAYKAGRPAGRIMGIINRTYNASHNEENARLFAFDCYNDMEVAQALTGAVEEWALKNGMKKVVGPFGFSDKDPQGFMASGYDEPMIISVNYNLPYMVDLITGCGYSKEIDLHEYRLPVPDEIPAFYEAIYNRCLQNNNIRLLEFSSRRELRPYIKPVFQLVNITFSEIYGFLKLTSGEMDYIAGRYLPVINPEFVKVVLDNKGEVAAFALAIPEIADGIRESGGRLYPTGFLKIIAAAKKSRRLTMLYGAIRSDLRGNGLDAFMGIKILQSAARRHYETIDSHLVLETNTRMLAEYKKLGGSLCRHYRIFYKNI